MSQLTFLFLAVISILTNGAQNAICTGGQVTLSDIRSEAFAWGDPHVGMFNKGRHDIQGQRQDAFYYYMMPCTFKKFNTQTMPFTVIGKHHKYWNTLKIIEYFVLQVFDTEKGNVYYVYIRDGGTTGQSNTIVGYFSSTISQQNVKTITDAKQDSSWKLLSKSSNFVTIGSSSNQIRYTYSGGWTIIELKTPGCTNLLGNNKNAVKLRMRGHYYNTVQANGYWHTIYASTDCYKCQTCGLLGDFYNKGNVMFNPITGAVVSVSTGGYPYNSIAYNDMWSGCRVSNTRYTPSPTTTGAKDNCADPTIYAKVKARCDSNYASIIQNAQNGCCTGTKQIDCLDEKLACYGDACAKIDSRSFEGTPTDQLIQQDTFLVIQESLKDECNIQVSGTQRKVTYTFFDENVKFCDAITKCKAKGQVLATIKTVDENTAAKSKVPNGKKAWIGLFRESKTAQVFKWIDGSSFNWDGDWAINEPSFKDDGKQNERCAQIDKNGTPGDYNDGKWNDIRCYKKKNGKTHECLNEKAGYLCMKTSTGAKQIISNKQKIETTNGLIKIDYKIVGLMIFIIGLLFGGICMKCIEWSLNNVTTKPGNTKKSVKYSHIVSTSEEEMSDISEKDAIL